MKPYLYLPLKKEWYLMIESGVKKEEYREIKPFWCQRLMPDRRCPFLNFENSPEPTCHLRLRCSKYDMPGCYFSNGHVYYEKYRRVKFSYGYTKRTMTFELLTVFIGEGNPEWGAISGELYFVLKLGTRLK